jgi:YVTN family beta-propeller protein
MNILKIFIVISWLAVCSQTSAYGFTVAKVIEGDLSSKSVVYSGTGLFFAQNMMYRHTIAVYNRNYELIKVIPDRVKLADFGYPYQGSFRGAPVEAAFSEVGKYAWVSNYEMSGKGFEHPGNDECTPADKADKSFVYKINTDTLRIENAIMVGSVPKFIAATPDSRTVLVSNWCSWDVSVIDTAREKTVRSVYIGRYPRGLAVSSDSRTAYIAVMGSYDIAVMDLVTYKLSWLRGIGRSPRHLVLSPDDTYLYATLNGEDMVAKIDIATGQVVKKVNTGQRPRSMTRSGDGKYLYVVNYMSDTVSKVDTATMTVVETVNVNHHPIGITFDPETRKVWVACYSGTLMVLQD